jgi:inorganic pyrophosphatase
VKLKYEPGLGAFVVSRPLVLGLRYPFDWGFVPSTRAPDGDPVDVMVLWEVPTFPGVVIPCRALGVLEVEQDDKKGGRERNDRLFAMPVAAPRMKELRSVFDLSERDREELGQFFLSVTHFAQKNAKLLGWGDPEAAEALLQRSLR